MQKKVIFRNILFQQIFSRQVFQAWCGSKLWVQQWVKESPCSCSRQSKGCQGAVSHLGWFVCFLTLIYLALPGLSCGMWDLVPRTELETWPPALGAWVLATRPPGKSPATCFVNKVLLEHRHHPCCWHGNDSKAEAEIDPVTHKAPNIYYLALDRQSLLGSGRDEQMKSPLLICS